METKFRYDTVTNAVNILRSTGFNEDFKLHKNNLCYNDEKIKINDLKIITVFRYEGNTDPADEGILITGDGIYSEASIQVLKKLHLKINEQKKAEINI
jgi:hypothetical protein